jgi:hypothetical protein
MMSPIDRAARALALAQSGVDEFDALDEGMQETLRQNVRAVVRAIREPSEGMAQAGFDAEATANAHKTQPHHVVPAVWQAMIDAALADEA